MEYEFHFASILENNWEVFIWATLLTIRLSGMAMALGLTVAIFMAVLQRSRFRIVTAVVYTYVAVIRNTPFLVQLFLVYFGLPTVGFKLSPNEAALFTLSLNAGAYCTEIVRAGLESINPGQVEAGQSLGLSRFDIFWYIVILPALQAVYPALTSQFIIVMLNSSIVSVIAANELTSTADHIASTTFQAFEVYLIVTLIYLAISLLFSFVFRRGQRLVLPAHRN